MKKNVTIIFLILFIIIILCFVAIKSNSKVSKTVIRKNSEYEQYLNSEILGTDVITLINRAMSENYTNNVLKDKKGLYLNNNKDSILIDLVMITNEEEGETTTYKMEAIAKVGVSEFIKNFNTVKFECTKKEYHTQTGRISYIQISQMK